MYILQKKDKPRTAVQSIGPQTKLYIYRCIYCRKKISLVLPCKASAHKPSILGCPMVLLNVRNGFYQRMKHINAA